MKAAARWRGSLTFPQIQRCWRDGGRRKRSVWPKPSPEPRQEQGAPNLPDLPQIAGMKLSQLRPYGEGGEGRHGLRGRRGGRWEEPGFDIHQPYKAQGLRPRRAAALSPPRADNPNPISGRLRFGTEPTSPPTPPAPPHGSIHRRILTGFTTRPPADPEAQGDKTGRFLPKTPSPQHRDLHPAPYTEGTPTDGPVPVLSPPRRAPASPQSNMSAPADFLLPAPAPPRAPRQRAGEGGRGLGRPYTNTGLSGNK